MKKTIRKKVYDTETATVIKQKNFGSFGESDGYEETLYKTEGGLFFLYTNGGSDSKYPTENIVRVSKEDAEKF